MRLQSHVGGHAQEMRQAVDRNHQNVILHALHAPRFLRRQGDLTALDAGTDRPADFAAEWWELYPGRHLSISTLDT